MANENRLDLISHSALLAELTDRQAFLIKEWGHQDHYTRGFVEAVDRVNKAPTVDAAEVVHGRWKYYHKQNIAVCTNCSFERDLDANFGKAISCPNCGAKMDGKSNVERKAITKADEIDFDYEAEDGQ